MARIPYPDPQALPERTREFMAKLPKLNIFRMLSHSDHLIEHFVRFGNAFLAKGTLDAVTREIAILRVGYLSAATYETHQHERIGKSAGMSDALIAAIKRGPDADGLTPQQQQVLRYVDDLVHNVRASDATFAPLREQLGIKALQELTLVTGYYMMVCRFLSTFDVDIEQPGERREARP
jgi:alkylhydroperoxidase family enzyme